MNDPQHEPTREEIGVVAFKVWGYKQGELVSLLIHLGDRLGLYRAMAGAGPLAVDEVAGRTGLHARWVLEWLRGQAAAGLLRWDDTDRFELSDAAAAVLADEQDSLFFAAGAFGAPAGADFADDLADAFRTGIGMPYDRHGPSGVHRTERMLGPWTRLALVPRILPALDGVIETLDAGGIVADVGCGAGVAAAAIATSFPNAHVHGYDLSRHAIERARQLAADTGLDNVTLHHMGASELPDEASFDLVLTLDCLHDMTRPAEAIAAIRRSIKPDGTWLIKDIRCAPDARTKLANPMAEMVYAFSSSSWLSSALSEPGGAGLGTLGLHPELLERLCAEAGFRRFRLFDVGEPGNLYYEVRP